MRCTNRLSEAELEFKIVNLKQWYMPIDLNSAFHNNKVLSIRKLDDILERSRRKDLQEARSIDEVLICALTLIYYFGMRLKLSRSTPKHFPQWCSKRQFLKAETVFQKTMDRLLPERSEATITIMLTFFTDVTLWPFETFVEQILEIVLYFIRGQTTVLNMMLTDIHKELFHDVTSARHRMRVLYELLKSDHFVLEKRNILLPFVKRLLDYYTNTAVDSSSKLDAHSYVRKGFEVCLRRIFERAPSKYRLSIITTVLDWFSSLNIKEHDELELFTLVKHATEVYEVCPLTESLPEGLVVRVLTTFVGSPDPLYSLVGCCIIRRFLDRELNAQYLIEPKLYFEVTKTQLKLGNSNDVDKTFIQRHRDQFHEFLTLALKEHCEHSANLKALFTVICCMILEVPCELTAAAAACMMMFLQDFALNGKDISPRCRHWMHAIVISVMSLICWVHKAPILCKYVNQIITVRANEAPHLNPPLLQDYKVKRLNEWTTKTLFFEDWELRYGLWKAFSISPSLMSDLMGRPQR